jgi:hypothetical protein
VCRGRVFVFSAAKAAVRARRHARAAAAAANATRAGPVPYLELVQVLEPADQVVLQVQDLELGAEAAEQLDALEVELVQRHLLERGQEAVVVLGALSCVGVVGAVLGVIRLILTWIARVSREAAFAPCAGGLA